MNVEFIADDPRQRARERLDQVLSAGADELAVACAFCTGAGVEILKRHAARLQNGDSFVVISAAPPTDHVALSGLHNLVPGRVFVHWGALSPDEIKIGTPLMHSKVFYSRAGKDCWLWTGSHNLTANATQGMNCEAALLIQGRPDEKPFVDALKHLHACRAEARVYDPEAVPPGRTEQAEVIWIHAEAEVKPAGPLPWHVHLCLESADFDELLSPPADVRLFLYPVGSLLGSWQRAVPIAAYGGSLTGLNLTVINPRVKGAGTTAEWREANFSITEERGVLVFAGPRPPGPRVTTQAVFSLDRESSVDESLFSERPRVESVEVAGGTSLRRVDHDVRRFYHKSSVQGDMLLYVPIIERHRVIRVSAQELRPRDYERLRLELAAGSHLPIEPIEPSERRRKKLHPFIVRAKYRLGEDS
jgi:hypothetical protein